MNKQVEYEALKEEILFSMQTEKILELYYIQSL